MAETGVLTSDALAVKVWRAKFLQEYRVEQWFRSNGMIGMSDESVIQEFEDLNTQKGDRITCGIIMALTGTGASGNATMETNEEEMGKYYQNVTIDRIRNAVLLDGSMSEQRIMINLRDAAKNGLKVWVAEREDSDLFTAQCASPTKVYYGGAATSTATLTATDYMTLDLLSKCKAYAMSATPKLPPVRIGGKPYYVVVMHTHDAYDLRINDPKYAQWRRDSAPRQEAMMSSENLLLNRAFLEYDDMLLFEHPSLPIATTWGAGGNVAGATALFMGRQAGFIAFGGAVKGTGKVSWQEKTFDYGEKTGFCIGTTRGQVKAQFNSKDYSCVNVKTARTNVS